MLRIAEGDGAEVDRQSKPPGAIPGGPVLDP
jgi:hypothetical protein